jgi:hypothetical protein
MSAIQDAGDAEPVQVLVTLHDQMNLMDVAGPLEVMSKSLHNFSDPGKHPFTINTIAKQQIVDPTYRQQGIRHHRLRC